MELRDCRVGTAIAVSDMDRAAAFYEGALGLVASPETAGSDNRAYPCGGGTLLSVYVSPEHAGMSTATLTGFSVQGIEDLVRELTARGVVFERYDDPPIVTDALGIAHFPGDNKVAYFQDPDGNTHSLAQAGSADGADGSTGAGGSDGGASEG